MWKPVRLQGSGAATFINAVKRPPEKLKSWRDKVQTLLDAGNVDLLPGQPATFDLVGAGLLGTELGAGITVLAKRTGPGRFAINASRIDGFTISGADGGGGIFVNGYANNLEISNNHVTGNSGVLHGGIRIGQPYLTTLEPNANGIIVVNNNVNVHDNAITMNGAQSDTAVAGGLALCTGTNNYTVFRNFICGNFTLGDGGGIGHLGLSNSGLIEFNQVLFNQSFNQGLTKSGGGILVAGEPPAVGALTLGAGNVTIDANLVQGNQAGSGHGGGIRLQSVNGTDTDPGVRPNPWLIRLTNNMIVNNVAGWSGAGISLQDTVRSQVVNNTIAGNDSTATVGGLVDAATNISTPQPAGISAERHSLALAGALGTPDGFSSPLSLVNNIVWQNRSFTYDATTGSAHLEPVLAATTIGECPAGANYWDVGVLGEPLANPALKLDPRRSILTDTSGYHASNIAGDPDFLSPYCNGARTLSTPGPMQVAAEVIEGGNFIDVRYGPLTPAWPAGSPPWDYHIGLNSAGLNNGNNVGFLSSDFDNEHRPQGTGVPSGFDRGADEVSSNEVPPAAPPTLTSIVPNLGTRPAMFISPANAVTVTLNGTNLTGATAVNVSGAGIAVSDVVVNGAGTQLTATFTITYNPNPIGSHNVSVTTPGGTSNTETFTVSAAGTVALSASFTAPGGGLNSALLSFGNQTGAVSSTVTYTVIGAPVTFGAATVTGSGAFSKGADSCSGATVASGNSCMITVNFNAPNGFGFRSGTLAVPHNGASISTRILLGF
jgi:parallel beta-helix repeat protein